MSANKSYDKLLMADTNRSQPCFSVPHLDTNHSKADSSQDRSKTSEMTHMFVDNYQQEKLHDFYNSYVEVLENINISKPELVKRSFEQYMDVIEDKYIEKMTDDICGKIKDATNEATEVVIPVELLHETSEMYDALGTEFYVFYKVLDMHWKQQDVQKKDLMLLSPCKIFLLQSVVKRKYGDELDFK